jgi:hypothetical protein
MICSFLQRNGESGKQISSLETTLHKPPFISLESSRKNTNSLAQPELPLNHWNLLHMLGFNQAFLS